MVWKRSTMVVAALVPAMLVASHLASLLLGTHPSLQSAGRMITLHREDDTAPLRVVLMSDTHVIGPEYGKPHESNPVDNDSILKTPARLKKVRDAVNALLLSKKTRPELAVFVGDVVHDALDASTDYDWFVQHRSGLDVAAELFVGFGMPVHYLWGNHDYKTVCGDAARSVPRATSHRLFRHFFDSPPYQAVDVGPWRLVLANSQLGESWDPMGPACLPRLASYGPAQLKWLDTLLEEGRPTIVFAHFPLPSSVRDEAPGTPHADFVAVLTRHARTVRHVFTGHYHRGYDWGDTYGFPLTTLPAVRYDDDNYFVLELAHDGSAHGILDWEKNRGGARCSDTWSYSRPHGGAPGPEPGANETGDCGSPAADEAAAYRLPPIQRLADVPGSFNPEPSCWFPFFEPVLLGACGTSASGSNSSGGGGGEGDGGGADGGEEISSRGGGGSGGGVGGACCELMVEALKPVSTAYFASCLCQPDFWRAAEALFAEKAPRGLADTIERCLAANPGALIQYRGVAACPAHVSGGIGGGGRGSASGAGGDAEKGASVEAAQR